MSNSIRDWLLYSVFLPQLECISHVYFSYSVNKMVTSNVEGHEHEIYISTCQGYLSTLYAGYLTAGSVETLKMGERGWFYKRII